MQEQVAKFPTVIAVALLLGHLSAGLTSAKKVYWLLTRNSEFASSVADWQVARVGSVGLVRKASVALKSSSGLLVTQPEFYEAPEFLNELAYYLFPIPVIFRRGEVLKQCDKLTHSFQTVAYPPGFRQLTTQCKSTIGLNE